MADSDSVVSPTETWNIGKNFSMYHVLLPFIECKRLVKICLFGVEDITDDMIPIEMKNLNKVNAMKRLLEELKQIIDDTMFVMDKKTKKTIEELKIKLEDVEKVIDGISLECIDTRTGYTALMVINSNFNFSKSNSPPEAKIRSLILSGVFNSDKTDLNALRQLL